jgi:hypothetical protein
MDKGEQRALGGRYAYSGVAKCLAVGVLPRAYASARTAGRQIYGPARSFRRLDAANKTPPRAMYMCTREVPVLYLLDTDSKPQVLHVKRLYAYQATQSHVKDRFF